jgi:hypothetical protein
VEGWIRMKNEMFLFLGKIYKKPNKNIKMYISFIFNFQPSFSILIKVFLFYLKKYYYFDMLILKINFKKYKKILF